MNTANIVADLENLANEFCQEYQMDQVGYAMLERPHTMDFYLQWLEEGHHGSMNYLKEHAPLKESAKKFWPLAHSALVFTKTYYPHPRPTDIPLQESRLALYSQGEDYHHWFKRDLSAIAEKLKQRFAENEFMALTDSSPVLERDLAARAGLGWFGKNTCLIHPQKGSLFFIGEIYTDLPLTQVAAPLPDFCGTCTRCLEICPTGALESPRRLNAEKCISYLTIEAKTVPAEDLRAKIGDWLYGCDLCQTVCPWNQKVFKSQGLSVEIQKTLSADSRMRLVEELRFLLSASGKKLQKEFKGSALLRAGPFGLRRNALVVAANQNLWELRSEIQGWMEDEKLGELAQWSLQRIHTSPSAV